MVTWLRTRWRGIAVIATTVLVAGGLVAGGVMAQTPPAPTPTATAPGARPPAAKPATPPAATFISKLAGKLGIGQDKLESAMKETSKEMVDEAVAAGRLPAEAAARLKQRIDAGPGLPWFGGHPGRVIGPAKPRLQAGLHDSMKVVADWLGMTPEALGTELRAGKSLAQVAESKGKTRDQLITFLTDRVKQRLNEAVANKRLTQEQADAMLKRFQEQVGNLVDRTFKPVGPRGQRPLPPRGGQ